MEHVNEYPISLARMKAHTHALALELDALEKMLQHPEDWSEGIRGRTLLYVGGRPQSNAVIRALVTRSGGTLVSYVGLIDNDTPLPRFVRALQGVDMVVCPLDLIDPDSLQAMRYLCRQHGVPWCEPRSSSVASFVAQLQKLPERRATQGRPAVRVCCH